MVKKIIHDPMFLRRKSVDATEADKQVVTDLLDTLRANLDRCVGMAANMIGVKKNIIVVAVGPFQFAMINPVITKKSGPYETEEGCLSLSGVRPMHEVPGDRGGLPGSEFCQEAWKIFRMDSADHPA